MPMPAVPAPWMTIRWSVSAIRRRGPRRSTAASATAAVPCMSSLKVQTCSGTCAECRRALVAPKSSQCSIALGEHAWHGA